MNNDIFSQNKQSWDAIADEIRLVIDLRHDILLSYIVCCNNCRSVGNEAIADDTDALPPDGYVKWTVPTQTYLVAECNGSSYGDTFNYVVNTYIP